MRRTGKVRQSETDILPLCHATNPYSNVGVLAFTSVSLVISIHPSTATAAYLTVTSHNSVQSTHRHLSICAFPPMNFVHCFAVIFPVISNTVLSAALCVIWHALCSVLFCSLAVADPRVGHTMQMYFLNLSLSSVTLIDFHWESCPRLGVVHPGRVWSVASPRGGLGCTCPPTFARGRS